MMNVMKGNQHTIILLVASLIGLGIGYYILNFYDCGNSIFCYNLFSRVGEPLFYGMGAFALVFLILLILPQAFEAWKKFAIWFVPFAALLFIWYPEPGSGDFFSPYPEQVFQWVSGLYVLISLAIITLNARKKI